MHGKPTSGARVGTQVAAVKRRTFAHADQPMPGPAADLICLRSRSVIENLDLELGGSVVQPDMRC